MITGFSDLEQKANAGIAAVEIIALTTARMIADS